LVSKLTDSSSLSCSRASGGSSRDRAFVLIKAVGKSQPGHVTALMLGKIEQEEKEDGYVFLLDAG
jgi:hypothetical protein